jgi:hypothetical protein
LMPLHLLALVVILLVVVSRTGPELQELCA